MALHQRGAIVTTDGGLPSDNTLKIGLKHLEDYIVMKRNIYMPKVEEGSYHNFIMLCYYRNPLNYVFFNESVLVCALFSIGMDVCWRDGIPTEKLFERTCYLASLIKREEVLKERFTAKNRAYFESTL